MSQITDWVRAYEAEILSLDDLVANLRGHRFAPYRSESDGLDSPNIYYDSGPETEGTFMEVYAAASPETYGEIVAAFRKSTPAAPVAEPPPAAPSPKQRQLAKAWRMPRRGFGSPRTLTTLIDETGFAPHIRIAKTTKKNLVFGWASVIFKNGNQLFDQQGHAIDADDLEEAAYRHVEKYRQTGVEHATGPLGSMVESIVFTPDKIEALGLPENFPVGWWVGYRVPPSVFAKVEKGELKMFSVQGGAILEPVLEE